MLDPNSGNELWDFEIVRERRDKHRNKWTHRPHLKTRCRYVHAQSWPQQARVSFVRLVNLALAEHGQTRRLDHRKYEEMGIEETPIPRIGPKAYQKEKKGIATPAGDKTVAAQWDREQGRLAKLYDTIAFDPTISARFKDVIGKFRQRPGSDHVKVQSRYGEWRNAIIAKRELLADRAATLFNIAKIKSRLLPPLNSRPQAAKDEIRDFIDEIENEEITTVHREYRTALVREKVALDGLNALEASLAAKKSAFPTIPAIPVATDQITPIDQTGAGATSGIGTPSQVAQTQRNLRCVACSRQQRPSRIDRSAHDKKPRLKSDQSSASHPAATAPCASASSTIRVEARFHRELDQTGRAERHNQHRRQYRAANTRSYHGVRPPGAVGNISEMDENGAPDRAGNNFCANSHNRDQNDVDAKQKPSQKPPTLRHQNCRHKTSRSRTLS